MQHFLYFKPLPQGHGSLRPIFESLFLKKSTRAGTSSEFSHPYQNPDSKSTRKSGSPLNLSVESPGGRSM